MSGPVAFLQPLALRLYKRIKDKLVQHLVSKPPTHFTWLGLGQHVCQVVSTWNIADLADIHGCPLPHIVVGDGVGLLLQLAGGVAAVVDHRHVVSQHTSWLLQQDPIILSLKRRPSINSTAVFMADNSEPNEDDSMDPCFLV